MACSCDRRVSNSSSGVGGAWIWMPAFLAAGSRWILATRRAPRRRSTRTGIVIPKPLRAHQFSLACRLGEELARVATDSQHLAHRRHEHSFAVWVDRPVSASSENRRSTNCVPSKPNLFSGFMWSRQAWPTPASAISLMPKGSQEATLREATIHLSQAMQTRILKFDGRGPLHCRLTLDA